MVNRSLRVVFLGLFLFSVSFSFVPVPAYAAALVPCGRTENDESTPGINEAAPCTLCHIIIGGKGVMDWMMRVMTYIGIIVIVAMAILYIISVGNDGMMSTAKNGMVAALIGFVVILGAWLIVNTLLNVMAVRTTADGPLSGLQRNGMFNFSCNPNSKVLGTHNFSPAVTTTAPTSTVSVGALPASCSNYETSFQAAAASSGVPVVLLRSIAAAESTCVPSKQSEAGSCGLMQLKPSTAGMTCEQLKSNPERSIQIAASYLKTLQSNLNAYQSTFDIGNSFTPTLSLVTVAGRTFDRGNDDLIAAYNAGSGNSLNAKGERGPFMVSIDCPAQDGKSVPAWQCPINPGGFSETQNYVQKVQGYMKQ